MKLLILLILCFSMISCGDRGRIRKIKEFGKDELNVMSNEVNIGIFQKISLSFNNNSRKRNIQPICRGIDGCLNVCEYFDNPKCKQLSVKQVLSFWLNQISMYEKWEQARNDLTLIATQPDVSDFLSTVDLDNHVMEALFNLSTAADCPINNHLDILFSYSPYVTLYLGAPQSIEVNRDSTQQPKEAAPAGVPEAMDLAVESASTEAGEIQKQMLVSAKKKIMDGQILYFNLPIFVGYIKQCFGYDTKTFSQLALEIENKKAFEMGDEVISKACSENSECIRLAYCAIDSELVWKNLKPNITEAGCSYESFSEMLP